MMIAYAPQSRALTPPLSFIYSSLADSALEGGASDPAYYWSKLDALGIACASRAQIDRELRTDATSDAGNRIVRYGADGAAIVA